MFRLHPLQGPVCITSSPPSIIAIYPQGSCWRSGAAACGLRSAWRAAWASAAAASSCRPAVSRKAAQVGWPAVMADLPGHAGWGAALGLQIRRHRALLSSWARVAGRHCPYLPQAADHSRPAHLSPLSLLHLLASAVIVCTLAAVSSMVTGVVVGVLGLAEALPHSAGAAMVRLISWAFILVGVAGELARLLCACLAGLQPGWLAACSLAGWRAPLGCDWQYAVATGGAARADPMASSRCATPAYPCWRNNPCCRPATPPAACSAGQRCWWHAGAGCCAAGQAAGWRVEGAARQVRGAAGLGCNGAVSLLLPVGSYRAHLGLESCSQGTPLLPLGLSTLPCFPSRAISQPACSPPPPCLPLHILSPNPLLPAAVLR